jgi:O-antigen/teichoic acid export membrane protein
MDESDVALRLIPEADVSEPATESLSREIRGTRAGLTVLVGVATLNLANALFHLVTARELGPSQYSEVVSLVTLSGLIALPFGGAQLAVARIIADEVARGRTASAADFAARAARVSIATGTALTVMMVCLSPLLQDLLGITRLLPVVLVSLYTLPALVAPVAWGLAQGLQRFAVVAASMGVGAVLRVVLVVALIPFGLGVGGAMGATLLSGIATVAIGAPLAITLIRQRVPSVRSAISANEAVRYFGPVIGGTLAITLLTTTDVLVAKLALSSHDAGIYGSASFIGRLLLYLPMTVATVLLPKVTSRAAAALDTREILSASLAVTGAFSLLGTVVLIVGPKLVIAVTFGSKYDGAIPLVGIFGFAMTVYALLNVQFVWHLGHGRPGMAWLLLGGSALQILTFSLVHGSTYQLVTVNLLTGLALLAVHEVFFESTLIPALGWTRHRIALSMRGNATD